MARVVHVQNFSIRILLAFFLKNKIVIYIYFNIDTYVRQFSEQRFRDSDICWQKYGNDKDQQHRVLH